MTASLATWVDPSLSAAARELERLQQAVLKEAIAPGVAAASQYLADIQRRSVARDRTGTLRQSIGSTGAKIYPDVLVAWAGSGPRRGFGRVILTTTTKRGKVKLKRTSKQFTAENRGQVGQFADPVRYAHFLISGRKASVAGRGKRKAQRLFDSFTGRFFGHQVAPAPKKDFIGPAAAQAASAADEARAVIDGRLKTVLRPEA